MTKFIPILSAIWLLDCVSAVEPYVAPDYDGGVADTGADVLPDVHSICCVVPEDAGCAQYIYGCVFTCGKASNGLTDVPWLAFDPAGKASDCASSRFGERCHTITGDGLVEECR